MSAKETHQIPVREHPAVIVIHSLL
jgi:hypothetical protein